MDNLLDTSSTKLSSRGNGGVGGMVRYGSTGSISSLGSAVIKKEEFCNRSTSRMTQTPTSLYSQESSGTAKMMLNMSMESDDDYLLYDVPRRTNAIVKKSNSRVSSNGRLRLRVESFRNENNTTVGSTNAPSVAETQTEPKYTGQYRKNGIPPKPARKHKPKSEHRSDRSASPDNSSTSGYSSPSASGNGNSPSKDHHHHHHPGDSNSSKEDTITVIQIDASVEPTPPPQPSAQEHQFISPPMRDTSKPVIKRELPRIATNGTLQRPLKRKLPDRTKLPPPPPDPSPAPMVPQQPAILAPTPRRNSYLPRPTSSNNSSNSTLNRRVPLPPVPELDRSDHERSISPPPMAAPHKFRNPPAHLPSPLTTPVTSVHRRGAGASTNTRSNNANNGSTTKRQTPNLPPSSASAQQRLMGSNNSLSSEDDMEEKLKVLLTLMNQNESCNKNKVSELNELFKHNNSGNNGSGAVDEENTVQYLSQLESVARKLKDHYLQKGVC